MRRPEALADFLDDRADWTFGYGRGPKIHDCARFASDGHSAVTGYSPLKALGSTWSSELGAARVLRRRGGLAKAVGSVMTPVAVTMAQRGDLGMTEDGALVLVEGETVAGLDERGLYHLPRSAICDAWTSG